MNTVNLTRGCYLPVCTSCGRTYEVIDSNRATLRMTPYCFFCKTYNVKFEKMEEMGDLAFSNNWNGKLNCECFTTIRLADRTKYYPGARKRVILKGQLKGFATILQVKPFLLEELNEFTARIDTGLSLQQCADVIRTMYKHRPVNWKMQPLALILLQYDKDKAQTSLFGAAPQGDRQGSLV